MSAVAMQMPLERFCDLWSQIQRELDQVPHVWEPWYTKQSIWMSVQSGQWQVWGAGHDGSVRLVLFTQIAFYPAAKVLQGIILLGNSFDESVDALWASLEHFARQESCERVEVVARKGFERKLSKYGLRSYGVALGCRVNELRMQ